VCVRPADVARAREILAGTEVAVGTVIGFPHGSSKTETKVFEAEAALRDGATELDMVINIAALRSGRDHYVRDDIAAVVQVAHAGTGLQLMAYQDEVASFIVIGGRAGSGLVDIPHAFHVSAGEHARNPAVTE
jgi:hypothetical protein